MKQWDCVFCEVETKFLCSVDEFRWVQAVPWLMRSVAGLSRPGERVRSQVSLCEICGGQSGTVIDFSPSTSVSPWQYHSTNAPHPFIHLPPTLYNVSLPVLQFFSPVSIIPPTLHTHSFTYHPHYIMYLSKHFCFPLSVPFHQCSTLTSICMLHFPDGRTNGRNMGNLPKRKSRIKTEPIFCLFCKGLVRLWYQHIASVFLPLHAALK